VIKKETIKDGVVETFYENGQLRNRKNYKNGKRGLVENFYKNGQLRNRKNYKAKKRNYKVKFDDDFDDDIPF